MIIKYTEFQFKISILIRLRFVEYNHSRIICENYISVTRL